MSGFHSVISDSHFWETVPCYFRLFF